MWQDVRGHSDNTNNYIDDFITIGELKKMLESFNDDEFIRVTNGKGMHSINSAYIGIEWALNQSDEIKNLIENNGYNKGFQDAIEKAKTIIINFMPLPSNKNHNINQDIDLLEERQKYAHQVAKKFEEMMNTDER